MMKTNREEKEPEAAETPRTVRVKTTPGEGILHVGKAPGHEEVNLNPQGRLDSDTGDWNCSVEDSSRSEKERKSKTRKTRNKRKRQRRTTHIGTWNVQIMLEMGKLHLLINELKHQKLNITGLCECRWRGGGHFSFEDHLIIYNGGDKSEAGVAIILDKTTKSSCLGYDTVSDRILVVHLDTKPVKTTIIKVYAPTSTSSDEDKEDFYNQIQATKDAIKD